MPLITLTLPYFTQKSVSVPTALLLHMSSKGVNQWKPTPGGWYNQVGKEIAFEMRGANPLTVSSKSTKALM